MNWMYALYATYEQNRDYVGRIDIKKKITVFTREAELTHFSQHLWNLVIKIFPRTAIPIML